MLRVLCFILSLTLSATAAAAPAQKQDKPEKRYEIELVAFQVMMPDLEGGEIWGASELMPPAESIKPEEGLAPDSRLAKTAAALEEGSQYRILARKRWVQTGEDKANAKPALIEGREGELGGTVRFFVSRFLHLDVDLRFQPSTASFGAAPAPAYVIQEARRIRTQETHYFDHPKFGVIVRVTPAP